MDGRLSEAQGRAERDSALEMVADQPGRHRITMGADKLYDFQMLLTFAGYNLIRMRNLLADMPP